MTSIKATCSQEGCEKIATCRGLCPAHYSRFRRGVPMDTPLKLHVRHKPNMKCSVGACNLEATPCGTLCVSHRQRAVYGGPLDTPIRVPLSRLGGLAKDGFKKCAVCWRGLPVAGFSKKRDAKDGLAPRCKECLSYIRRSDPERLARGVTSGQEFRKRDPEYRRRDHLRRTFNISMEQFYEMSDRQGGVCAICKEPPATGKNLDIDHDHRCCPGARSCGMCVRALLCRTCNVGVGYVETHGLAWWAKIADFVEATQERSYDHKLF